MGLQRVRYDLASELYWTSSGLPAYTHLHETERNFGVFCRGTLSQLNCLLSRVCEWNEYSYICVWASLVAQMVKKPPAVQETRVWALGQEDPLEKEMATHSSVLAWRIPWAEEPGGSQSLGLQRVRHNWATNTFTFSHLCVYGVEGVLKRLNLLHHLMKRFRTTSVNQLLAKYYILFSVLISFK